MVNGNDIFFKYENKEASAVIFIPVLFTVKDNFVRTPKDRKEFALKMWCKEVCLLAERLCTFRRQVQECT